MNRGNYDILLIIEQPVYAENEAGQNNIDSYAEYTRVWAERSFKSGGEQNVQDQQSAVKTVVFKCGYVSNVTESMRINRSGTYYNILDVDETIRGRQLQITAEKRDNVGG